MIKTKKYIRTDLKKIKRRNVKDSLQLLTMSLPAIAWFLIFSYTPMVGLIMSFQKYSFRKGIFGSDFCGLENFRLLFKSMDIYKIVKNTILYNAAFIVLGTVLAVFVAILINELRKKWQVKVFQTGFLFPYFISWVVVGYISTALFNYDTGFLNNALKSFGQQGILWYQTPGAWPFIIVLFYLWKGFGYSSLVYLGAISAISSDLYEAANIDGCTRWKSIRYITIPLLKPMIIIMFLMSIGSVMRADFGLFYYVPNNVSMLYPVTDVIDTYIMRSLTNAGDLSLTTAIGFVQSVVGLLLVIIANGLVKRYDESYSLF